MGKEKERKIRETGKDKRRGEERIRVEEGRERKKWEGQGKVRERGD